MRILVVAAHPDDEVLGCGGSIARWSDEGCRVQIVLMAEGITSRDPKRDLKQRTSEIADLHANARKAADVMGASLVAIEGFPDNRMDTVPLLDVVKVIESHVTRFQPQVVLTHHESDLNVDHRVVHQAVVTACRPLPGTSVLKIAFFEVPSATDWKLTDATDGFSPNLFVDISSTLSKKLEALKIYESEMRPWPHARSLEAVEHLARWRGAVSGLEAAEGFVLGRDIVR